MGNPDNPDNNSTPEESQPAEPDASRSIGRVMIVGFWILVLGMGSYGAQRWLERAANLNSTVSTRYAEGRASIQLRGNRYGHYIATGQINDEPVLFLVDTGASSISIPQSVADRLGLNRGSPQQVSTANGLATVYAVKLASVGLGDLERQQVQAHINPHLPDEQILLGMTFLRHFELIQRAETLTISTP